MFSLAERALRCLFAILVTMFICTSKADSVITTSQTHVIIFVAVEALLNSDLQNMSHAIEQSEVKNQFSDQNLITVHLVIVGTVPRI